MRSPAIAFSTTSVDLKPSPINPAWIRGGTPMARNAVVAKGTNATAYTLIWECTPGSFDWFYDIDETIHVLEGSVLLSQDGGPVRRIGPGDIVFFPKGSSARWVVESRVRKLAFFTQPVPKPVEVALWAVRRLQRGVVALLTRGQRQSGGMMPNGLMTGISDGA